VDSLRVRSIGKHQRVRQREGKRIGGGGARAHQHRRNQAGMPVDTADSDKEIPPIGGVSCGGKREVGEEIGGYL
jgi:hypothetical protein